MPKLRHYDESNTARFITISCYHRFKLFNQTYIFESFLRHLELFRTEKAISVLGYVIMPSHVHLVLYPHSPIELGKAIGELKSKFAFEIISGWRKENKNFLANIKVIRGNRTSYSFWQLRCYDHNCRTPEIVREKINYCHNNPVRAGLVEEPGDWRWSSYNWYIGNRDEIVTMDEMDDLY